MKKINFEQLGKDFCSWKLWMSWLGVALGVVVMSAGFVLFTNPYEIIPGGVYGLGRVLHYVIPTIQTGTFGFLLDIPLMITALIVFGAKFGVKTLFAAVTTPLVMNMMTNYFGENPNDGISIISQYVNFSDNVLVAAIFGGVLIGAGVGFILRSGATSGGTDIVSMILVKFAKMKFSTAMFIVESVVVITGMLVLQDWKLPFYSLIAIFVSAKLIDYILDGGSSDKLLFIMSDRKEELKSFILNDMERGGTYVKSSGMYTDKEKDMIFLVVSRREITTVKDKIRQIDPNSFLVVVDAHETYGDGFKDFKKEELM